MSRSDLSQIEETVWRNINQYFDGDEPPQFVIAVSGGMDSMTLLYVLYKLGISGWVVHLNYQKRGTASDKDAELVEQKAEEWGFEYHTVIADPSAAEGKNFQQWARDLRYNLFSELRQKHNADGIAVAHHKDDQIETILQKLFRGAGLAGWSGMDIWDGHIFRPLLNISRDHIQQYAKAKEVPYRTDESNFENDFARNFLRNEWLDKLSNFFPGWKGNLLGISQSARHFEQALGWISSQIKGDRGIDRKKFHSLESGLQKSVVLWLLKQQKPELEISQDSLKRIDELGDLQAGKEIELTPSFSIIRDRDHYVINASQESSFDPLSIERHKLNEGSQVFNGIEASLVHFRSPDFERALYLDTQKMSWPITIRRWKDGDALQPLGMDGHQKVADHLTNRKVRTSQKEEALVVESFDNTICAIIFPSIQNQSSPGTISDQVKCDEKTNRCLQITHRT